MTARLEYLQKWADIAEDTRKRCKAFKKFESNEIECQGELSKVKWYEMRCIELESEGREGSHQNSTALF